MISLYLFAIAIVFTLFHMALSKKRNLEILLNYILLFNMGLMGLIAAYGHIYMGPEIAEKIGWEPGSPFQFEIGMANLSYGVLGIIAFKAGRGFKTAAVIGWSVLLLGCFIGHIHEFLSFDNTSPYNIGIFVWLNDLLLPLLALTLLCVTRKSAT